MHVKCTCLNVCGQYQGIQLRHNLFIKSIKIQDDVQDGHYSIISYIYQCPNIIKNKHQVSKCRFSNHQQSNNIIVFKCQISRWIPRCSPLLY